MTRRLSPERQRLYIWRMVAAQERGEVDEVAEYSLFMNQEVNPIQVFNIKRELCALLKRQRNET